MSFLKINHDEANNNSFEPIAPGKYEATISEVEVGQSKKGAPMLTLTITIRDDVDQPFQNRKIWEYLVDSPNTQWKFQQVAKGIDIPNGTDFGSLEEYADAIRFKHVEIVTENRNGQDQFGNPRIQTSVKYYNPTKVGDEGDFDSFTASHKIDEESQVEEKNSLSDDDDAPF